MVAIYDKIGVDYANLRKPDPRIAAHIHRALGNARTVVNIGAGTGSYEPTDRDVTAVEPSAEMISQRTTPAVQASAEALPFADNSFDAAMAVLTVHHWADQAKGMAEMRRVARGPLVLLTFDPDFRDIWLLDYFPQLAALDASCMPKMADYTSWLGTIVATPVPVPHDCTDGFLYAYWRRPAAYLDPRIRAGMSSFWKIGDVEQGLARLADDLQSGAWERHYGHFLSMEALDLGYRLLIA